MLQQIPILSALAPSVMARLAEHGREVAVRGGELCRPPQAEEIRFYPDGASCTGASGERCTRGFEAFAPRLMPWLAGASFDREVRARRDGVAIDIATTHVTAALEDEFSLYIAIASATAREIIAAQGTTRHVGAPVPRLVTAALASESTSLVERVLFLYEMLPFARDHVGALVQLAQLGAELRADGGVELWREGDPADNALFLLHGQVRAQVAGRADAIFGPGSVLGGLDVVAAAPRWFTATAEDAVVAMAVPVEGFIDVLEDSHDLARNILQALAKALISAEQSVMKPLW
ncbi:MAG: cyclic nucleotide-binding domain-containing protein [Myxococcales bacterium]|nr:cyclic nucleotide-binding domain-containing protein [Myxococcales bacterium]